MLVCRSILRDTLSNENTQNERRVRLYNACVAQSGHQHFIVSLFTCSCSL